MKVQQIVGQRIGLEGVLKALVEAEGGLEKGGVKVLDALAKVLQPEPKQKAAVVTVEIAVDVTGLSNEDARSLTGKAVHAILEPSAQSGKILNWRYQPDSVLDIQEEA